MLPLGDSREFWKMRKLVFAAGNVEFFVQRESIL